MFGYEYLNIRIFHSYHPLNCLWITMGKWSFPCNILMSLFTRQSFPCNLVMSLFMNKWFRILNMIMLYSNIISSKNVVQKKKRKEKGQTEICKTQHRKLKLKEHEPQQHLMMNSDPPEEHSSLHMWQSCLINANRFGQTYSKFVCYNEIYFFFWPLCCSLICWFCLPLWYLQTLLRWDIIMLVYTSCYFARS